MHLSRLVRLSALPFLLPSLTAQAPPAVRDERKQHLPDVAFAGSLLLDVDQDGDLDAVVGGESVRLLLNLGRMRFADISAQAMPPLGGVPLAAADVDRDGDLDLFTSGPELLLNEGGTLTLASVGRLPVLGPTHAFAVADVDGDRDIDVVVSTDTQAWLLRNDGSGVFHASASIPGAAGARLAHLTDLDRDGDFDLLAFAFTASNVLINDGTGQFSAIAGGLPVQRVANLAVADFDRDGDPDLAATLDLNPASPRALLVNDGTGRFVDETASRLPVTQATIAQAVAAHDFDADGDVDLLFGQNDFQSELLLNDGAGRFTRGDAGDLRTLFSPRFAVGDLDRDGALDLLTQPTHLLRGSPGGAFALLDGAAIEPDAGTVVAFADLTGEGDLDLLQAPGGVQTATTFYVVKRNDGTGTFRPVHYTPALPPGLAVTGDVDGDQDLDLVHSVGAGTSARQVHVLRNQGGGTFAPPTVSTITALGVLRAAWLEDLDRDGDRDLIHVGSNGVAVAHNDGSGTFTARSSTPTAPVASAERFDYDGDADGDLVLQGGPAILLENQNGTFVDVTSQRFTTPPGPGLPRLATFSGHTWLFVVGYQIEVYEYGASAFVRRADLDYQANGTLVGARIVESGALSPAVDMVVRRGSVVSARARVLRFEERSGFTDVTAEVLGDAPYEDVLFAGDVDTDGDADLVGARGRMDQRLLRGTSRSFQAPFAALRGQQFELRLRDGSVTAANPALVSLVVGTGLARLPLPFAGILRVDPHGAIVLPPVVVPAQRAMSFLFPVPDVPALRGIALVAQPYTVYVLRGTAALLGAVHEVIR